MDNSPHTSCKIPNVQQMYSGKCIFITGATGFVGKVLLEKLIRSCPGISEILVLIRSNPKYTATQRLQKLLKSNVFDRIKKECPRALDKVRELDGDVTEMDLKLSPKELQRLRSEVHIVFHCAASVRFENDSRDTLKINLLGVKNVMSVCESMEKLMAVVHVSTAYSFCNKELIDEVIYEESLNMTQLEETVQWMNCVQLKELCDSISNTRPSLYQYSKALAEVCIKKLFNKLPIIIVRPSIVTASVKEPQKGWIDNYNGPSGFIALSSKGILKTLLVKDNIKADWVPVDTVVNTVILAAHYLVVERLNSSALVETLSSPSGVPVINCVCPATNSINWTKVVQICIPLLYKYPSLEVCRLPGGPITSIPMLFKLYTYVYHYLPAVIMDAALIILWKEPRFVNNYRRIHKVLDFLQIYTMNKFSFKYDNMYRLHTNFRNEKNFPIDLNSLNWEQYLEDYVRGVRFFFLKEQDSTLPQAQIKLLRLQRLFFYGKLISTGLVLTLLMKRRQSLDASFYLSSLLKGLKSSWKFIVVTLRQF